MKVKVCALSTQKIYIFIVHRAGKADDVHLSLDFGSCENGKDFPYRFIYNIVLFTS